MICKRENCKLLIIIIPLCVILSGKFVNSYKILGVSFSPMKSNHNFFSAIMRGLAADGNAVTFISPFQSSKPIKNLREIRLDNPIDINNSKDRPVHSAMDINGLSCFSLTNVIYTVNTAYLKWAVDSKSFRDFLHKKEKFDVVLVFTLVGDAMLSLGHYFNAPIIAVSPHAANKWTRDLVGAPSLASFVPHTLSGYTDRMNFWQRTYNSLCYLYEDMVNPLFFARAQQEILDSLYANVKNMPTFDTLKRNVSLVLYNSLPGFEPLAPAQPNLIPVGGLFIDRKAPQPLPRDLGTFLNHTHGVIYIAFGSNLDFSHFDKLKKEALIGGLAGYPKMRIILQSKEHTVIPSHNASNVLIRSWLPQQAILAHKNVKLFISHGGLLSIFEAAHFAKPTISIPIFFDQNKNSKTVEHLGNGIRLSYEELTVTLLRNAIKKIFTDPSYREQTKLVSQRYWNQLRPPLETAVYWVKYVARHNGAPHLRSIAIDMPFYVYYNLDCCAFLIGCCALNIFISIKLGQIVRRFFKKLAAKKMKLP